MTEATERDIYIEGQTGSGSGVIFEWIVTLEESAGVPMTDIDSATSTFNIKTSYVDSDALVSASMSDGITLDSGTGIITLSFTLDHFDGNITFNDEAQEYYYDWDFVDDNGKLYRLYKGIVTLGGDL